MEAERAVAGLPLYALIPAVLLVLVLAVVQARRAGDASAAFLIVAIAARSALDALHVYTFKASGLGLSLNALASLLVIATGLLVIRRKPGLGLLLLPVFPWLAVMVASSIVNIDLVNAFTAITKLVYYIVLAIAAYQAADRIGPNRLMQLLLPIAVIPLLFQLYAIPLGVTKAGESDGSVSYIGGFYHEAAYSMLILNAMLIVGFADTLRFRNKLILMLWCMVGIFLANYRTTILAAGPLLVATLFLGSARSFVRDQRALVGMLIFGVGVIAIAAVGASASDRFGDLAVIYQRGFDLIQPPRNFSFEDRHLLSGRPTIWSTYIYAWRDGSGWQRALGFGPESWSSVIHLYAHNTLVSALYETGILGVASVLFLWIGFLFLAFVTPAEVRARLVAAHLTFIVMNMATMPFWMIEGVIYYAVLCGLTVHYVLVHRRARGALPRRPIRPSGAPPAQAPPAGRA